MFTASLAKITKPRIALSMARLAIAAAHAEAERYGLAIAVAVADADGELVALEKRDVAAGISPYLAIGRARDAVLWQASFDQAGDYLCQGRRGFLYKPDTATPEGSASVKANGIVIGAIGISGTDGMHSSRIAAVAARVIEQQAGFASPISSHPI